MTVASHLRSLQALELAVRTGSLAAAAETLSITPAAVGQRIKALEEYLGAELLLRGRGGIRPAPALAAALPHLQAAFGELDRAADALEMQRGHELHLAGPSDFIELWLRPRLDRFRALYPRVRFNLNGEGDAPMRIGRVDCRIGFGPLPAGEGETDLLFRDFVLPIGSPANVARTAGMPQDSRLEGFPLLHVDFYKDDAAGLSWGAWIARNRLARTAPERGIRFQRIEAAVRSVLADAGFALCGIALLREAVEAGRIDFPYPQAMGVWTECCFTAGFRPNPRARGPQRIFREWLIAEAAETRCWLEETAAA